MRLLALSDLHGNHSIIKKIYKSTSNEEINVIVVCGDMTHFGNLAQANQVLKEVTKLGILVLFVPGNCDPEDLATIQSIDSAINIHGKYKKIEGLGFLGIGGSPPGPFHTSFEVSENDIKKMLNNAHRASKAGDRFVLVSHSPPMNTKVGLTSFGVYAGSRAVREFVESEKPSLVISGHIHEAKGTDIVNNVLIVNPGPASKGLYATVNINGYPFVKLGTSQ